MWKKITHGQAALSIILEFPMTLQYLADAVELGRLDIHQLSRILSVAFGQHGLGIKGVDVGHPTVHIEKNNAFGSSREMRLPRHKGVKGGVAILS